MKLTQLSGFAAVIALMLISGTPSFARGGGHGGGHGGHGGHRGHGGHSGHAHAAMHRGGHSHHFANHGHAHGGHFGRNHGYAHNHAGWNHNGWGYGRGRGWGRGWGWGHAGWWGRGYGRWGSGSWSGPGLGYAVAGAIDPSFYYQYLNNVSGGGIPVTCQTVTRINATDVTQPVSPLVSPTAAIDPGPVESTTAAPVGTADSSTGR